MASTYSDRLRLELIGTGEQSGTWGNTTNTNLGTLLDEAIAGVASITMTDANYTLTEANGATDQSRKAVLVMAGTLSASRDVICPSKQKVYIIKNNTTGGQSIVLKTSGGVGVTVPNGNTVLAYCNGTDVLTGIDSMPSISTPGNANISGNATVSGTTTLSSTVISTSSATDALRITQTGAGNALVVEDSANPDATPFVIDTTGRMNVGGTSWYASTGITPSTQLNGTGQGASIALNAWQSGTGVQSRLIFNRADSSTQGDFSDAVDSGDVLGSINFTGSDGTAFIEAANITSAVDGTPGTNDMPGRLVFSTTADGASTPTERMRIGNDGSVGIGSSNAAGQTLRVAKAITGAVNSYGVISIGTVQSDVSAAAFGVATNISTAATSFTLTGLQHFSALQGTFGAGSTVTNQYGFVAGTTLIGATNNYGFYSNIAAGTGRWNFYANGTADNYFGGKTGVGTAPSAQNLLVSKTPTSASTFAGVQSSSTIDGSVLSTYNSFYSIANTAAGGYTLPVYTHYLATQGSFGALSAITTQTGFRADATISGATTNYGFYSALGSGGGTTSWNFYAAGSADNYFAGNVGIGKTPTVALDVNGTVQATAFVGGGIIPSGTVMLFVQTAAPTGWTKDTSSHNNKALRVVTGTASSGGSVAFTTAFASQAVSGTVGSTTLTTTQMPSHNHSFKFGAFGAGGTAQSTYNASGTDTNSTNTGGGFSHNHSFTGTAINLAVQYVDVIIATKD